MKLFVILLGALAVGALVVMGCQGEDNGTPPPPPPSQAEFEAKVKKVQDDPNIPEASKGQAIAGMKAAYEAQKAAMAGQGGKPK